MSLTKLSSLLSCAFAGAMAGKQTASTIVNVEAPKSAASNVPSALHGWHAALGSAEPHVMLAVPCRVMLACDAKRVRAACIMHAREAFLACSGLTKTLVLRCCTGTVCLCSPS